MYCPPDRPTPTASTRALVQIKCMHVHREPDATTCRFGPDTTGTEHQCTRLAPSHGPRTSRASFVIAGSRVAKHGCRCRRRCWAGGNRIRK
eukprot:scaffold25807_cov157-Isochrysis_galbana.AAC.2